MFTTEEFLFLLILGVVFTGLNITFTYIIAFDLANRMKEIMSNHMKTFMARLKGKGSTDREPGTLDYVVEGVRLLIEAKREGIDISDALAVFTGKGESEGKEET